ncbi:DNA mismatch repair protein MutT [Heyndrickxia sporothermodurans]|uniref:8-oxo-dGTP diphosphatase n=1 Tax=Heyndrickxia sporothermodurans TaxID=46224 RepID=A0AB37HDB9_9BACI|nr:8-oxo-dGTP diphosphatase [Heyndrickxia sporothermodurans]MBL5766231.1 8-oxo-dGTP diphosphatase [Heyndrickxia sporothermodurans]MBL5769671.1 8-oxo-dGTP diphosphatase [Heyndrickxia sporothermodurans]MBL5773567.1 8-oxo-dGTP diphosphatase [Heyndrickxia sporothermodurans]MBL5776826.1 8-oxo-dGTP diphosphatase [Heyndrickxia sporothermodurans]MBL5780429.1 8-oxo-dGTP diphosphatase [Heyndrickxia sporothermodurans]
MYKYTICFIKKGQELLMLNRHKPVWMGIWNGVGGKIEMGETPLEGVLREVEEETGLQIEQIEYKGTVTWTVDGHDAGGMYVFVAELPETFDYYTPVKTDEGILDWKNINWVLHPENLGMANVKYYLDKVLYDSTMYEHHFIYEDGEVVDFKSEGINSRVSL